MKKRLGIVEGFYGTPWSHENREFILKSISKWGYNTYIYAPKDDPHHRELWRDEYSDKDILNLIKLYEYSKSLNIDFFFTISPGGSIKYSSDSDYELLLNKFLTMYKHGIKNFGLFFDDIAFELPFKDDKDKFVTVERAQNYLLLKLYRDLQKIDNDIVLSTCPTLYHGRGNDPYVVGFCKDIPEDLLVFWTGREVCSQVLSSPDAAQFKSDTGHKPTYWDNYPVNDSIMKWELHLGPYDKRDYDLLECCDGVILNPMEYVYSSLISLQTVGEFFQKGEKYNKALAWNKALEEQVPTELLKHYKFFAKFCYKSCIYPYFSNKYLMSDLMESMNRPDWNCGEYLKDIAREGSIAGSELLKSSYPLVKEAHPWIQKFLILMKLFNHYGHKDRGLFNRIRYRYYLRKFILNRHEIFQLEVFNEIDKNR